MDTVPEWQLALVFVVRWYLGIFFLTSALGKLTDLTSFVQGTLDYRVLPGSVAKMFALALPWLELGLTALLLTGIALPVAGWGLAGLLGCFIVAVTMNLRWGRAIACNCHGIVGTRTISWGTVARNFVLLALALVLVSWAPFVSTNTQWLALWQRDIAFVLAFPNMVVLALLLAFCSILVQLTEWSVEIGVKNEGLKVRG